VWTLENKHLNFSEMKDMTRSFSWLGKCPSIKNGGLKLVLWCDAVMQKKKLKRNNNWKK
jgi:hypothetical protein